MELITDHYAQMSYIKLRPNAQVHSTRVLEEESVVLDVDEAGNIVGIELFGIVQEAVI